MTRLRRRRRDGQRGQGLVEFALVLPIMVVLVISVVEIGLIYGSLQSLGYGSREGARVASAMAYGTGICPGGGDPDPDKRLPGVDAVAVGAVQRILKSPDSGIDLPKVQEIRIFKATAAGDETAGLVNYWDYAGAGAGPDIDPDIGAERIDFTQTSSSWPACTRNNGGATPDSVGVTVLYTYDFVTPMASVLDALAGGNLSLTLSETTVMALNPTS